MAAPSPALSSNSSSLAVTGVAGTSVAVTASFSISSVRCMETPSKTLCGLNKPKCRVCGNVTRSRCPYESCKNCFSKNQNPCHIHVLKANETFQDRTPTSNSPSFDQQSTESSPSGSSLRMAYFRQLLNNFAQFNNVHISLRSRKPLSRKDAAAINGWIFLKLREYQERNIEAENEAFDRYMQNLTRRQLRGDGFWAKKYMLQSNMMRPDNSRREYGKLWNRD